MTRSWQAILAVMLMLVGSIASAAPLVISDVTVISPELAEPLQSAYVTLEGERILAVDTKDPKLADATKIDGKGRFLVPGLIDGHVHLMATPGMSPAQNKKFADLTKAYERQLPRSYLYYGYTTVVDLNVVDREEITRLKNEPASPDIHDCDGALVFANGYPMHYVPDSARFDVFFNFIYDPKQEGKIPARFAPKNHSPASLVPKVKKRGAVCVKTHYEPGFDTKKRLPTPSRKTLDEVARESHRAGLPLMVHANSFESQSFAVGSPIDVFAHGLWNWGPYSGSKGLPPAIRKVLDKVVAKKIGYMPTFQVLEGLKALFEPKYLADPRLKEVIPAPLLAWYGSAEGQWFKQLILGDEGLPPEKIVTFHERGLDQLTRVVAYLDSQHARLVFGSDTPSAPTFGNVPGLNGFIEMQHWVKAGVSLPRVLQASTLENARLFGLESRLGSVSANKVANLLLLKTNPLQSVDAYDSIELVILHGKPIPRESLSARAPN